MTDSGFPVISKSVYRLEAPESYRIVPSDAYRLYAWMLSKIPTEYAELFHQDGETPVSQYLYFDHGDHHCYWSVSLLSEAANGIFAQLLEDQISIQLNPETLKATRMETCSYCSGEEFILKSRERKLNPRTSLILRSTLSFKQAGRYVIFPQEQLILHSLISKWNQAMRDYPIDDEDAVRAICDGIQITDYSLHTNKYQLKGVRIPGCVGKIQISSRMAAPLFEIWSMLAQFSQFSGLGIKTTLGMGGIELLEPEIKE